MTDKPLCNTYVLGKQIYDNDLLGGLSSIGLALKLKWNKVMIIIYLILCIIFIPITIILIRKNKFTGFSIFMLVVSIIFTLLLTLSTIKYLSNKRKLNKMIDEKSNCTNNPNLGPQSKKHYN